MTKKITLARALKEKNRLSRSLRKLNERLVLSNSVLESNEFNYDAQEVLNQIIETQNKLVELKAEIQKANVPIFKKIFRIGEYRSHIDMLRRINTTEGEKEMFSGEKPIKYKCQFNQFAIDEMVENLEDLIDSIQDEIDKFNHNTYIEVDL